MSAATRFGVLLAALGLLLAGCAGTGGGDETSMRSYDLGIDAPAAALPPVQLRSVRAVQPYDGVAMHYRLAYRHGAELAAYAQSRWAAPPPELVRKQIARATGRGHARCALDVEVQEFSQVYGAQATSSARVELVASLVASAERNETRAFRVSVDGGGANAAEGVAAMRRAVAQAVGELARWIESVPACRG